MKTTIMKSASVFFLGTITSVFLISLFVFGAMAQSEGDLRIVPSVASDPWKGRLEIFVNQQWGTICSQGFDASDAIVACKRIGEQFNQQNPSKQLEYASAAYTPIPNVGSTQPIWLSQVACTTVESSLLNCSAPIGADPTTCNHAQDVGVSCVYYCPSTYSTSGVTYTGPYCNTSAGCYYGQTLTTGVSGSLCNKCDKRYSGTTCLSSCTCANGPCTTSSPTCATCDPGFTGSACSVPCSCDPSFGTCNNSPSFPNGCFECNPGFGGVNCNETCGCEHGSCSTLTFANISACVSCDPGWTGADCNTSCECEHGSCSSLPTGGSSCTMCDSGWTGLNCNVSCSCTNGYCSTSPYVSNICVACKPGWTGINCSVPCSCPNGTCATYPAGSPTCLACKPGFYGVNCTQCNCPPGGGVCDDGFTGTGECYTEGTLRLVGASQWNGLLEAWVGGQWGTMCTTYITQAATDLMCHQLLTQAGLPTNLLLSSTNFVANAPPGSLPIVWQQFSCPPNATRFIECNPYVAFSCSSLAGVICNVNESCPTGYVGANCDQPCTCKNGVCDSKRSSNGSCTSCISNEWTGANCDIPCPCTNGYCSGSSLCSICKPGNYGPLCKNCNCTGSYCSDGVDGDGQCFLNRYELRLSDATKGQVTPQAWTVAGRVEIIVNPSNGFTPICASSSTISTNDVNVMCRQMFGTSGSSGPHLNVPYTSTLYWQTTNTYICNGLETQYSACASIGSTTTSCTPNLAVYLACNVTVGCGNNIVDVGEQCDGGPNCDQLNCSCPVNYHPTTSTFKVGCAPTPIDCTWNEWGDWGKCSSLCGSVTRARTSNPAINGGRPCVGSTTEVRICNLTECMFTCADGSEKSLDTCRSQYTDANSPCLTMTTCANYPSAVCQPDPCNSCAASFFVNGVRVDCKVYPNPTGPPVTVVTIPPPPPGDESVRAAPKHSGASVLVFGGLFMVVGLCFNFINFVVSSVY